MLEGKEQIRTLWDSKNNTWHLALNQIPTNHQELRKVANFVNEKGEPLTIKEKDKIDHALANNPVYKEQKAREDSNNNATITGGSQNFLPGEISSHLLTFFNFASFTTISLLTYFRLSSYPPFNATEKEIKAYQEEQQVYLAIILGLSFALALSIYLTTVINLKHTHNNTKNKEEYEFIKATIKTLPAIEQEIELKGRVIGKLENLICEANQAHEKLSEEPKSLGVPKLSPKKKMWVAEKASILASKVGSIFGHKTSLPEKTIPEPTKYKDWIIFTIDGFDDLNIYKNIDDLLSGSSNDIITGINVVNLLKIKLKKEYREIFSNATNKQKLDEIDNLYTLIRFADEISIESNSPMLNYTFKSLISILNVKSKLVVINDLVSLLIFKSNENNDNKSNNEDSVSMNLDSNFLGLLEENLTSKSTAILDKIHNNISKLNNNYSKFSKAMKKFLIPLGENDSDIKNAINAVLEIIEDDRKFDLFISQVNPQFAFTTLADVKAKLIRFFNTPETLRISQESLIEPQKMPTKEQDSKIDVTPSPNVSVSNIK